jgi:signal transduction histidine kinase
MRLILLCLLFFLPLYASETYLDIDQKKIYFLGKKSAYFVDHNGSMSISEIQKQIFTPSNEDAPSNGFSDLPYWLKINLHPRADIVNEKWYLKIDYPLLDHIELYAFDAHNKLLFQKKSGELEPFEMREIKQRHFLFAIPFKSVTPLTLYVKIKTTGSVHVPVKLMCDSDVIETEQNALLFLGVYYGIAFIIFIYNAILYSYTRDSNYLRYLLFLVTFIIWQLSFDGLGAEYLWPDSIWAKEHGTAFWIIVSATAATYFGRNFLQTFSYAKNLDRLLVFIMFFGIISAVIAIFYNYTIMIQIGAAMSILIPVILLLSSVKVLGMGNQSARFYILGWGFFLVGSMLFSLNKFNLIGGFYIFNYAQQIGSSLEMIFLSWALADRVYLLRLEYNQKLEKLNITLQERVAESLFEIRKKDQLLAHQARLASIGETIEQIAHQWRQPLNNLALINQDTYFKKRLGTLDDDSFYKAHMKTDENLQFMSKTIDDFRDFFNVDEHDENVTCKPSLIVDQALILSEATLRSSHMKVSVECHDEYAINIKKNEMIQVIINFIKNSVDAVRINAIEEAWMKITIDSDLKNDIIRFEDNAGGIETVLIDKIFEPYVSTKKSSGGTGIGLYMSRMIVEKYQGSITVSNTIEGACFEIRLPRS